MGLLNLIDKEFVMAFQGNATAKVLDTIFEMRTSSHSFGPDLPPEAWINDIIQAGVLAPHVVPATDGEHTFRRFVIVRRDSAVMLQLRELIKVRVRDIAERLSKSIQTNPIIREKGQQYLETLQSFAAKGVPGVGNAPYLIVVAERRGFPQVEQQVLAHVLENMWLKATSLGLGFHLVSFVAQMAPDKKFCELLGIPCIEYELNACAVGFATAPSQKKPLPKFEELTRWL